MNNIENIYKFADSLACETKLNEPMKKHTSFKIGRQCGSLHKG